MARVADAPEVDALWAAALLVDVLLSDALLADAARAVGIPAVRGAVHRVRPKPVREAAGHAVDTRVAHGAGSCGCRVVDVVPVGRAARGADKPVRAAGSRLAVALLRFHRRRG